MSNLLANAAAQILQLFRWNAERAPTSPAAALMESADLRAGVDAHHAQELRIAASAWLSVIR